MKPRAEDREKRGPPNGEGRRRAKQAGLGTCAEGSRDVVERLDVE